jgi:hypothetical protein
MEAIDVAADEQRLVAAILGRDRKAAAELVSRYADAIYSYVRHRLAPRADLVDDLRTPLISTPTAERMPIRVDKRSDAAERRAHSRPLAFRYHW